MGSIEPSTPVATRVLGRRADLAAVAGEVVLLAMAVAVGTVLNRRGVGLHADAPPVYGGWGPHLGWGTPLAVATAAVVIRWGPGWARRAPWWRLLGAGYLGALAWTMSLALVDGWSSGLARRLTRQGEYLQEVPRVRDIPATLAGFADRILDFQAGSWATHVAGHPPGALLVFVGLDRLGLSGGGAAGLFCVLVGASVAVWVPVALRALGAEAAARAVLPFLVLFPGAVWVGASADGVFAGVVAAGLALLAVRSRWANLVGGVLLGLSLYLSYGLTLIGLLALAVLALRPGYRVAALVTASVGALGVVAAFTAAGFWWFDGYRLVVQRYYQGWAADRPYSYWVWANLGCLVLAVGPVLAPVLRRAVSPALCRAVSLVRRAVSPALRRAVSLLRRPAAPVGPGEERKRLPRRAAGDPVRWLPVAAAAAVLLADLSGLSKAEVERIWLPFGGWLLVGTARLPAVDQRWWLAAQAATALAVNHLLRTNW
jgi:hypothetical protein